MTIIAKCTKSCIWLPWLKVLLIYEILNVMDRRDSNVGIDFLLLFNFSLNSLDWHKYHEYSQLQMLVTLFGSRTRHMELQTKL